MNLQYKLKDYLDATTHSAIGMTLPLWTKFLTANFWAINWRFLPRIIFISLTILIFTPLRWYERLAFYKKIKKQKVKPPIFILGHYRSGTTFMHYLVSKDKNLAFASTIDAINPHSFVGSGQLSNLITKFVLPEMRPMDNLKMSPDLPFEEEYALANMGNASLCHGFFFPNKIRQHFKNSVLFEEEKMKDIWKKNFYFFLQKLSYKHQGKTLLLKTPANTARVKEILELFPDAKFLHIYRNPYKVFLSNEGLLEAILPILSFQKGENEAIETYIFDAYQATYRKFLADKKLLKEGQLTEVAYEDFVKAPITELDRMYKELQLNHFEEIAPAIKEVLLEYKNYQTNQYQIGPFLKQKIYSKWGFAFKAFGYAKNAKISDGPQKMTFKKPATNITISSL